MTNGEYATLSHPDIMQIIQQQCHKCRVRGNGRVQIVSVTVKNIPQYLIQDRANSCHAHDAVTSSRCSRKQACHHLPSEKVESITELESHHHVGRSKVSNSYASDDRHSEVDWESREKIHQESCCIEWVAGRDHLVGYQVALANDCSHCDTKDTVEFDCTCHFILFPSQHGKLSNCSYAYLSARTTIPSSSHSKPKR